jgi:predicted AAA+ superfamily ATPase
MRDSSAARLMILESFYYHFRIRPFESRWIRSIKKEPKLYVWDWSEVPDQGARFENLVAGHLLKLCHFLYDRDGVRADLGQAVHKLDRGVHVVSAGRFLAGLV